MLSTLAALLSDEPIKSEDVAQIWAWIFGSLAAIVSVITLAVYRAVRHDQKIEAKKVDAKLQEEQNRKDELRLAEIDRQLRDFP